MDIHSMSTGDKRYEKGDRMREIILMTAIKLISEEGIEGVSAAKIAEACGISKSNVFHHFKTKDAILLAANELVIEMSIDALNIDAPTLDVFLERLLMEMLSFTLDERMTYSSFYAFYNRALFDPALNSQVQEALPKLQEKLSEQLFYHTLKPAGVNVPLSDLDQAPEYIRPILKSVETACRTSSVSLIAFMDGVALQLLLYSRNCNNDPKMIPKEKLNSLKSAVAFQIFCVKQHLKHPL